MKKLNTDPATNTQANQDQWNPGYAWDTKEDATSECHKKAIQVELVKTKRTNELDLVSQSHAMNHMQWDARHRVMDMHLEVMKKAWTDLG